MSLLVAVGANNIILTSPDGLTWTQRHADDSSGNTLQAIAWDGNQTYVAAGGAEIWSSTDGGVTWVSRTVPGGIIIGVPTDITTGSPWPLVIWDGHQFICGGEISSQGCVLTSPDGITWTKTNVADSTRISSLAFNGTTYVAVDWRDFIAQKSRIYSAASATGTWTLRLTSSTQLQYGWLATNGTAFLVFSSGGQQGNAYSADGITWNEVGAGSSLLIEREFFQVIWDPLSSRWIANGILANGNSGIATSPDGAAWTTRLDLGSPPNGAINQSVLRAASGNLYAWLAGAGINGNFYFSTDNGTTWTLLGANSTNSYFQTIVWTGTIFAALQIPRAADDSLSSSSDGLTWTGHVDDAAGDIALIRQFVASVPPPVFSDTVLLGTLTHKGPSIWSKMTLPPGTTLITQKEVQFTPHGSSVTKLGVLASFDDGTVRQLFGGTQDGTLTAVAVTWPLPDLSQLPFELRDTVKIFRELWVEGEDLPNFTLEWSTDGLPLFLPNSLTPNPSKVFVLANTPLQNRNQIGAKGRQIVFRFTHAAVTTNVPKLSYMKLDYDIDSEAAGGPGAGANY